MPALTNAILASQLARETRAPRRKDDAPLTREAVFQYGLTNATGTVVRWEPKGCFGFVQWSHMPIEFFLPGALLPKSDRGRLHVGSQILFDLEPGQADLPKPKAKVSNPRLIVSNR